MRGTRLLSPTPYGDYTKGKVEDSMMEIMNKETITSLELLEQINIFRGQDGKSKLAHYTLLRTIEDEFEDEITENKIVFSEYKDKSGKQNKMCILTLSQAKQVLVRESKFVRKAVIKYIEELENELKKQQPASYQIEDPIERAKAWIKEQEEAKKQVAEAVDGTDKIISLTEIAKAWGEKYPKLRVGLTTKAINQWLCYHDFIKHKTRNTFTLLDKGKELLLPGGYVLSKSHDKDSYNWGTKMINFFDDNPELLKSFEKYIGIHYEIQLAKWDREDEVAEMELLEYEENVRAAYDDIVKGRYNALR